MKMQVFTIFLMSKIFYIIILNNYLLYSEELFILILNY